MAVRGTPLPASVIRQIQRLRAFCSLRLTARLTATSRPTVIKYARCRPKKS